VVVTPPVAVSGETGSAGSGRPTEVRRAACTGSARVSVTPP